MDFSDATSRGCVVRKGAIDLTDFWNDIPVFNRQPFAGQPLIDIAGFLIRLRINRLAAWRGKHARTPGAQQPPGFWVTTAFSPASFFQADGDVNQYHRRLPVSTPKTGRIWENIDLPAIVFIKSDSEPSRLATIHANEHISNPFTFDERAGSPLYGNSKPTRLEAIYADEHILGLTQLN